MPGCGGLRKIRAPALGRGKRGGVRVVCLNVPDAGRVYLLDAYGKDEQDDLTPAERKQLAGLAKRLRAEATAAARREDADHE